jgi:dethiobiotin synthetase
MAARQENRSLDYDALLEFCRRAIAAPERVLLIEGVGGIMVPLNERQTVLDWMTALRLPLVLVAGTYLGSISHALTCFDVLERHGLTIKAIVVSDTPGSPVTMQNTIQTLSNFIRSVPIVAMRRMPPPVTHDATFAEIAALI